MPIVRPFTGLLYDPAVAGPLEVLTTPPYDAISPFDHVRYLRASPFNLVRLLLGPGEPGGPERAETDQAGEEPARYRGAGVLLADWRDRGVLRPAPQPAMYPYELVFLHGGRERRIRGIIAEVDLEPWGGAIIPHERTLPGPIEDRLMLLREVRANLSPVYAMLDGPIEPLGDILEQAMAEPADRAVVDESGTRHRLWTSCPDEPTVAAICRERSAMIADGHHRYAVALAYREEMRAEFGPGPWDSMMMLLVDASTEQPPVLPFHRVLLDGSPPPPEGHVVRDLAEVLALLDDTSLTVGVVTREEGATAHRVRSLKGSPPTVCALHEQLLPGVNASRLRFVPDAAVAEEQVRSGSAAAAFLLPPTHVEMVRAVVEARGRLPEKSTYFWPKPRSGMVLRPVDA